MFCSISDSEGVDGSPRGGAVFRIAESFARDPSWNFKRSLVMKFHKEHEAVQSTTVRPHLPSLLLCKTKKRRSHREHAGISRSGEGPTYPPNML